jgi:hypothetical protein
VHVPVNVCGNTIDIIGLLNPSTGNTCINGDINEEEHHHPGGGFGHEQGGEFGHEHGGGFGRQHGGHIREHRSEYIHEHRSEYIREHGGGFGRQHGGGFGREHGGGFGHGPGGCGGCANEGHGRPHVSPQRANAPAPAAAVEHAAKAPSHEAVTPQARPALAETGSETPIEGAAAAALIAGGALLYRRGRAMARG